MTETMTASSAPATAAPKSSSPPPAKPSSTPPAKSSDGRPELSPLDELKGMLEEAPKAETPKPKDKDQGPPEETDTDFQADTPKEPEAKPATERPKPANEGIKTLRTSYEAAKAKLKEYEAEIKTLRESKPKVDPGELMTQLEAANKRAEESDKRAEEAEHKLRFVKYQDSNEFKEKYDIPRTKLYNRAYGDISQMIRTDPETGNEVQGTKDDFNNLMLMGLGDAHKFAKQFGDGGSELLAYRRELIKLHESATEAVQEYKIKGSQQEKEQTLKQQMAQKRQADEFQKNVKAGEDQFPQWFKAEETDQRGNLMLKKGFDMANRLFAGAQDLEPAERAKFHAACFNYIRGFPYLAAKNHALESRVKELEATVKQYEDSGPAGGTRRNGGVNGKETDHDGNPVEGVMADAISELRGLAK